MKNTSLHVSVPRPVQFSTNQDVLVLLLEISQSLAKITNRQMDAWNILSCAPEDRVLTGLHIPSTYLSSKLIPEFRWFIRTCFETPVVSFWSCSGLRLFRVHRDR
ncbi:hypothetical protein ILYODFUR_032495 [Ilyodon furcidens]|uniref:Uncharacterized protein n=1 Tax=Ilyodon furcidens TaxID=33524 RepID=A0ABV0TZL6_9TELE